MLDIAFYLLTLIATAALAVTGMAALALPTYLALRWRDAMRECSASELAEIDRLLAEA